MLLCRTGLAQTHEEEARIQFDQGRGLFNHGRYEQAAIALKRAYELRPGYKILYYLGLAEVEAESYARALTAFTLFLDKGGESVSPKRAQEVEAEIERLKALVGWLEVECSLVGAAVMVDGERMGATPLDSAVSVDLGKHEVLIRNNGVEIHREFVRVAGGQRVIVSACSEASADIDSAVEGETSGTRRIWTWVAFGIGGAAGVGAVSTGSIALSMTKDVESECNGDLCSNGVEDKARTVTRLSWATNGLIIAAAVGAISGAVLYFFEPSMAAGNETVHIAPLLSPHARGISISSRF